MMLKIFLFFCALRHSYSNLIRFGDFQGVNKTGMWNDTANRIARWYLVANMSAWYVEGGYNGLVEQSSNLSQYTTLCAYMSSNGQPKNLCQNANLSIGSKYILQYSMYSTIYFKNMVGNVLLNKILVSQLLIPNPSTFKTQVYPFVADRVNNLICFNQYHDVLPPNPSNFYRGGLLDNVSLLLIQKEYILLIYNLKQLEGRILLQGNSTYNEDYVKHFKKIYDIFIKEQIIYYDVKNSADNKIYLDISVNYSFRLSDLKIVLSKTNNNLLNETQIEPSFSATNNEYFHDLNSNSVEIIRTSKNILLSVDKILVKLQLLSQIFFCSYFINMIIDLQFISLFYIFMQISVVPEFTKSFYYQVLKVTFSEDLIESLQTLFKLTPGTLLLKLQDQISEKIDGLRNEEPWFGYYGLSSRIIKNNFSNIVSLIWLAIKFELLKLSLRLIVKHYPFLCGKLAIKTNVSILLLTEFCFMIPSFLVSMLANVLSSVDSFSEKCYKIFGCELFLFFSFVCLIVYMLLPTFEQKIKYKVKQVQKRNETQMTLRQCEQKSVHTQSVQKQSKSVKSLFKKRKLKVHIRYSDEAFTIPLIFFISIFAYIGNQEMFLVMNSFTVLFRFYSFIVKNYENRSMIERFIDFLIGFLWVIHHVIFVMLFFYKNRQLTDNQMMIVCGLGFGSIFTIMIMVFLQIAKLMTQIIILIKKTIKFINHLKKLKEEENSQNLQKEQNDKQSQNMRELIFVQVVEIRIRDTEPIQEKQVKSLIEIKTTKPKKKTQILNIKQSKIKQ